MIQVKPIHLEWFHVITEPGDCTRYSFLVAKEQNDFLIIPYNQSFKYPQRLNKYDIINHMSEINITDRDELRNAIYKICRDEEINCFTIKAVAEAIIKIYNLEVK